MSRVTLPSGRYRALLTIFSTIAVFLIFVLIVTVVIVNTSNMQKFYAVFLDNGQVYFGKITKQTAHEITLEYVFYLKADTNLVSDEVPNANLSLVKLGNEIYKPLDRMMINRSHVLFFEEMSSQSEVMQAVETYEQHAR